MIRKLLFLFFASLTGISCVAQTASQTSAKSAKAISPPASVKNLQEMHLRKKNRALQKKDKSYKKAKNLLIGGSLTVGLAFFVTAIFIKSHDTRLQINRGGKTPNPKKVTNRDVRLEEFLDPGPNKVTLKNPYANITLKQAPVAPKPAPDGLSNPFARFFLGYKWEKEWNEQLDNIKAMSEEELKGYILNPDFLKWEMQGQDSSAYSDKIDETTNACMSFVVQKIKPDLRAYLALNEYLRFDADKLKGNRQQNIAEAKKIAEKQIEQLENFKNSFEANLQIVHKLTGKQKRHLNKIFHVMSELDVGDELWGNKGLTEKAKGDKQALKKIAEQKDNISTLCLLCGDLVKTVLQICERGHADFVILAHAQLNLHGSPPATVSGLAYRSLKNMIDREVGKAADAFYLRGRFWQRKQKGETVRYNNGKKEQLDDKALKKHIKDYYFDKKKCTTSLHIRKGIKRLLEDTLYFTQEEYGTEEDTFEGFVQERILWNKPRSNKYLSPKEAFHKVVFEDHLTPKTFAQELAPILIKGEGLASYSDLCRAKGMNPDTLLSTMYTDANCKKLDEKLLYGLLRCLRIIIPKPVQ